MTGFIPTYFRRTTSRAKPSASCGDSIACPPYLMTRVFPQNARMYGRAPMGGPVFSLSFSMAVVPGCRSLRSQDVAAQIVVADGVGQPPMNEARVDRHRLA